MRKNTIRRLGLALVPVVGVVLLSATVSASPDRPVKTAAKATSAPGTARPAGIGARTARTSFGARETSILGSAWNADNSPIKQANIRLRNVVTGKIAAATKANDEGHFSFMDIEGGTYVVELVNEAGKIQTIGHVFTIAPGETVATFVRKDDTKTPWGIAFFNNTAGAAVSAAASEGITALTPLALCVSPPGCVQ